MLEDRIPHLTNLSQQASDELTLKEDDVYKMLALRGYDYGAAFKCWYLNWKNYCSIFTSRTGKSSIKLKNT